MIVVFCEVYSRIVGYLRPISNWNLGRKQEFKDRKLYRLTGEGGGLGKSPRLAPPDRSENVPARQDALRIYREE